LVFVCFSLLRTLLICDHLRKSAASPCLSISAILAMFVNLGDLGNSGNFFPTPAPAPYVHPIPPKVTQSTQESAEGRNPKMQKPGLKPGVEFLMWHRHSCL
jgi:hypothetical protein